MTATNATIPTTSIRAVCFDVGGVLTEPIASAFLERARDAALDPQFLRITMGAFASEGDGDEPAHRLERGEISLDAFFALMGDAAPAARSLMDPESPYFVPAAFRPSASMHAFVAEVREMGLRTAIISNVVDEWLPWWEAVTPVDQFDVVVHSCAVGMRKPNPAIYHHTLELLGIEPHEALFLDDFPAMAGAGEAVGMVTVRVGDHAEAIEDARRLLLR